MKNIADQSENCNGDSTASTQNNVAFHESILNGNVLIRSGETVKKTHSFSRSLVKKLTEGKTSNRAGEQAINLAVVLQRLCWVIQKRTTQSKPWYAATIARFTSKLVPYLSPSGVHEMLSTWCNLEYVEADEDRNPTRYTVTKAAVRAAAHDRIRFNPDVAVAFGSIMVAVLLHNLCYHLRVELKEHPGIQPFYALSPHELATVLPYSERSLKRARKTLLDAKMIVRHPTRKRLYSIPYWINLPPLKGTAVEKRHGSTASKGPVAEIKGTAAENKVPMAEKVGSMLDKSQSTTDPRKRDGKKEEIKNQSLPLSPVLSPAAKPDDTAKSQRNKQEVTGKEQEQKASCSESTSFDQLQAINQTNDKAIGAFSSEHLEAYKDALDHLCYAMLEELSDRNLFKLSAEQDRNTLSMAFTPFVRAKILDLQTHSVDGITKEVADSFYFHAALEIVTLAFHGVMHPKSTKRASTAINQSVVDFVKKKVVLLLIDASRSGILWNGVEVAKKGNQVPAWCQYQLSASEKVNLFKESLDYWNRVGWMFADQTYRYNLVKADDKGMELVEELFNNNPELSVGELMVVLNACIDVRREQDAPNEGEGDAYWHVRRVDNLSFFVSKLGDILKQLDWTDEIIIPVLPA